MILLLVIKFIHTYFFGIKIPSTQLFFFFSKLINNFLSVENKSSLFLLLRIYRGMRNSSCGMTENIVNYRPFELKLSFREAMSKEQMPPDTLSPADSGLLLVMTATPVHSAYACELYYYYY